MRAGQAVAMAGYNRWMNERLYAICANIPDEERKRDRGAFFRSVHGTLNHLLLSDKVWLGRFVGEPFQARSLDQELHEDFAELRSAREAMDHRIETWASNLSDDMLGSEFSFTSIVQPGPKGCKLWVAVAHLFNHQTHHRGQVTALLSQIGEDYGVTDLMWLPGLVSERDD
jgi:uncharacterized damage-inducible protein DinB